MTDAFSIYNLFPYPYPLFEETVRCLGIEILSQIEDGLPTSVERIEVRPWRLGGRSGQDFSIGSGGNFNAAWNVWLEIIYWVNDVQFFYTRNFLHLVDEDISVPDLDEALESFKRGDADEYGFGFMLPETAIRLKRDKYQYRDVNDNEKTSSSYSLEISADAGVVIGRSMPGMQMLNIKLNLVKLEAGSQFMRDLTYELADVSKGKHPNPADFPAGYSDWPFIRQLNQKAYDQVSQTYREYYFDNPMVTEDFDSWLADIPANGHILDAGCGHGDPVITRLLEKGYHVTGSDLSLKMLESAQKNFPNVSFINQMTSELRYESEFDGVCSFSSLLYLDPIDLAHSIYRLYHALKPGGYLFLYSMDLHPTWRGLPYDVDIRHWMWSWTYAMKEVEQALEEHGYFKVLKMQDVTTPDESMERISSWIGYHKRKHEELVKNFPDTKHAEPDFSPPVENLPYNYTIIARREMNGEEA